MTSVKRKAIPDRVKLIATLRRFGLRIEQVQFDHRPPLALRQIDPATGDTIPPQNDPDHIFLVTLDEHRDKTFGKGGTKRATTAGSDIHAIAKARRLSKDEEEFRRRLLANEPGRPAPSRSRMKGRGFPKRPKAT